MNPDSYWRRDAGQPDTEQIVQHLGADNVLLRGADFVDQVRNRARTAWTGQATATA
ncbi:hypothetical protein [Streptomyces sp. NPDC057877]|uniref:hypothetical protein n=1 Tax=Streptomyces sp. NPDC057877 TaxID=3346269 RepID=UPI003677B3EE